MFIFLGVTGVKTVLKAGADVNICCKFVRTPGETAGASQQQKD